MQRKQDGTAVGITSHSDTRFSSSYQRVRLSVQLSMSPTKTCVASRVSTTCSSLLHYADVLPRASKRTIIAKFCIYISTRSITFPTDLLTRTSLGPMFNGLKVCAPFSRATRSLRQTTQNIHSQQTPSSDRRKYQPSGHSNSPGHDPNATSQQTSLLNEHRLFVDYPLRPRALSPYNPQSRVYAQCWLSAHGPSVIVSTRKSLGPSSVQRVPCQRAEADF